MPKTCNSCNTNDMAVMPIAEHEKGQNRLMKIIKWLIAVILVLIMLLVGSNIGWLVYESQFETVETNEEDIVVDAGESGIANYIGNDGDITNG